MFLWSSLMNNMSKKESWVQKIFSKEHLVKFSWRRVWVVSIVFVVLVGIGMTGLLAYAASYEDRVMPGVRVGGIEVGGMTVDEL